MRAVALARLTPGRAIVPVLTRSGALLLTAVALDVVALLSLRIGSIGSAGADALNALLDNSSEPD